MSSTTRVNWSNPNSMSIWMERIWLSFECIRIICNQCSGCMWVSVACSWSSLDSFLCAFDLSDVIQAVCLFPSFRPSALHPLSILSNRYSQTLKNQRKMAPKTLQPAPKLFPNNLPPMMMITNTDARSKKCDRSVCLILLLLFFVARHSLESFSGQF